METIAPPPECQIHCLTQMSGPLGKVEMVWQLRNRLNRIIKRRWTYILNWFSEVAGRRGAASTPGVSAEVSRLQAGDRVRVKSKVEILATLDRWNSLAGCIVMEEMWSYCGTQKRVFKRVSRFLDERDYRMKRSKGIVSLEGVTCSGTTDFGPCDRACFFFWKEEWLEKVD